MAKGVYIVLRKVKTGVSGRRKGASFEDEDDVGEVWVVIHSLTANTTGKVDLPTIVDG